MNGWVLGNLTQITELVSDLADSMLLLNELCYYYIKLLKKQIMFKWTLFFDYYTVWISDQLIHILVDSKKIWVFYLRTS